MNFSFVVVSLIIACSVEAHSLSFLCPGYLRAAHSLTVAVSLQSSSNISRPAGLLPITQIDLSRTKPIIGITDWWITGPFVVDPDDQHDSQETEEDMFKRDYLKAAGGQESPLKLPDTLTDIKIKFDRDEAGEQNAPPEPNMFLNQSLTFPTSDVSTQLLYWGQYHVFKAIYAAANVVSPKDQEVVLLAPANSPLKIWVNNELEIQSDQGADGNTHIGGRVHLRSGDNTILVKEICFPRRNNFKILLANSAGEHRFLSVHGGMFEPTTQLVIPRRSSLMLTSLAFGTYDDGPHSKGRYRIRDVDGRTVAFGKISEVRDAGINISSLPDGLYSLELKGNSEDDGELIFVGDVKKRITLFNQLCSRTNLQDLPCEGIPRMIRTSESPSVTYQLGQQNVLVNLIAQFEWSSHESPGRRIFRDEVPRLRLMWFRSHVDGSVQYYYLHLPNEGRTDGTVPLAVIIPNTRRTAFFDNDPTLNPFPLQQYARYADRYHMAFIAPFTQGKEMPDPLAETSILEAVRDVESRFNVDSSRVYLGGDCAEGRSALLLAEDYPESFSAVSTIDAATRWGTASSPWWMAEWNVLPRLRNLSTVEIGLTHEDPDYHSPASQARLILQEAQAVGIFPSLKLLPTGKSDFFFDPREEMFTFLSTAKRRSSGVRRGVSFAVTELRHNQEFWVQVDQLRTGGAPGYIDAEISRGRRIEISSENVERVAIDTVRLSGHRTRGKTWTLVWNSGQPLSLVPDEEGRIVVSIPSDGRTRIR